MAQQLPIKTTKLTSDQAAQALAEAYKRVVGWKPDWRVLLLMLAQTGLETGQWNLPTNNWGGVKFSAKVDPYFQYLACGEVINGVEQKFPAGDPHCIFAAYKTPADGAERYVRTLKGRASWWKGLHTKTLNGFITGLTIPGQAYFTASKSIYSKGMENMMNQFKDQAYKHGAHWWRDIGLGIASAVGGYILGQQ